MTESMDKNNTTSTEKQSPRRGQLIIFLVLMNLPLVLGLCLFLINQEYVGRMIFSCASRGVNDDICSQPLGWIMLSISIIPIMIADLLLLGANRFFPDKPGVLLGTGLICLLIIWFPAIFIILMGPAILVVMETPGFG